MMQSKTELQELKQSLQASRPPAFDKLVSQNVEFTRTILEEDYHTMDMLRWLPKKEDLPTTIGLYCELARKFLAEEKPKAAQFLLNEQLTNNISS